MREMWEAAEALSKLGLWVRIDVSTGTLTVYRDGLRIGQLRFPVELDLE
ncbi:hypothetical protein BD833_1206 [Blastococcus xanthinilyticus]|uniref:Uncharacterized protein n=2 Tax=Blastococcus xanthinilyticus TaxID=1564164 RepID=A0A5S5CM76_9ACTN|nr:hypothetical protein BD833_1206 [Blastococcus xanthinilyticus]